MLTKTTVRAKMQLYVEPELHSRLKALAALRGVKLEEATTEAIEKFLQEAKQVQPEQVPA